MPVHVELVIEVAPVHFHRLRGDAHLLGDGLAGEALENQARGFDLAHCQACVEAIEQGRQITGRWFGDRPLRRQQIQVSMHRCQHPVTHAQQAALLFETEARRTSKGQARTGGGNEDHSGDIFIAFATGNEHVPLAAYESKKAPTTDNLSMVNNDHISELFLAATEAVEEAIINALLAADTAEGNGHAVPGLDVETLLKALRRAGWLAGRPAGGCD